MKVLFIGGPADGQWREVEYLSPELCMPFFEQCPATISQPADPMATSKFDTTIYKLEKLQDQHGRYLVYVALDGSLIETLLEGYRA
jgi:hypothetical protein